MFNPISWLKLMLLRFQSLLIKRRVNAIVAKCLQLLIDNEVFVFAEQTRYHSRLLCYVRAALVKQGLVVPNLLQVSYNQGKVLNLIIGGFNAATIWYNLPDILKTFVLGDNPSEALIRISEFYMSEVKLTLEDEHGVQLPKLEIRSKA